MKKTELKKRYNLMLLPSIVKKAKTKLKAKFKKPNLSKYVNGILEQYGKL